MDVNCPKCGGLGRAPREKINTRLVCRKCRATFYVASTGRTQLGEPPRVKDEQPARVRDRVATKPAVDGSDWRDNLPEFTVSGRSALIAAGVALVVMVVYFVTSRPGETLADGAKVVAQHFVDGNLDKLKSDALAGTTDDLVQWYGQARPHLENVKKAWAGRDVLVGVLVIDENARSRSGLVTAIVAPSKATTRDESIHGAADAGGVTEKPWELMLRFSPDSWGKWRIDGKKMLAQSASF